MLKVYVTGAYRDHERELRIYKHIESVETNHPGRNFIRKLLDHFWIQGPHGRHVCLVHEPLGTSADVLMKLTPGHVMTLDDMKPGIRQLLIALDFLHSECHIIHTGNMLNPSPCRPHITCLTFCRRSPAEELTTSRTRHQLSFPIRRSRSYRPIASEGAQRPNNIQDSKFLPERRATGSR